MSSKVKKKRFRVKHQKVKLFRANEPLLSVFMWGVNHTINELSHVTIPVMLLPDDFRAYSKMKVDNHLFNKENMPSHYKIKEYCPLVFRNLRERFSIDDFVFKESLTRSEPIPIDSQGKSGAKFYESYNKLFVIKTLTSEEVERMHNFLKHYHQYIVEHHGKTLLPQYLAMYRLTVDGIEHYLVIMRNVFSHHLKLHKKYDLKGSTVDREASEKEREKVLPTFKDNDFIRDQMHITIGDEAKTKLFDTLSADVDFLTRLNLMDYSLLVGIHDRTKSFEETQQQDGGDGGGGGGVCRGAGEDEDDADEPCSANDSDDSTVVLGGGGGGGSGSVGRQTLQMSAYNTSRESGGGRGGVEKKTGDFSSAPESPIVNNDYFPYHDEWPTTFYNDGDIEPQFDIYAIPSVDSSVRNEIYFIALIDVLTTYGVRKQAAKAAKAVKYGGNVDGISTCDPEQYAKRFMDFISKSIE